MSQRVLMIVESPNKAKKIQGYFSGFKLMATVGHFKDLPRDSMGVEPPHHKPDYVVSEGRQGFISKLQAAAKEADLIYVATDPDREGEAIAAHVVNTLGKAHSAKVSRITYTEISRKAIESAIQAKRSVDWSLVRAQEARRVVDRYVGYLVSPELTKKFKARGLSGHLSAGRVQSVAVKLIDERQKAISNFVPVEHYGVTATLVKSGIEFEAVWKPVIPQGQLITDIEEAKRVAVRTHTLKVMKVLQVPRKVPAPKPLITTTYVRLMAAALKLTTKAAMDAAQKLFEAGLITYHRTDSPTMSDDFSHSVRSFAERNKLPVPLSQRVIKQSANTQQGHECLRVTDIDLMNARLAGVDDPVLSKVYELVWLVTLQSQLADGEDQSVTVNFVNGNDDNFVSRSRKSKFAGWRVATEKFKQDEQLKPLVAREQRDDAEGDESATLVQCLPELAEGDALTPLNVDLKHKTTEPESPYTEKTLVEKLEKLGIGRPSTYAATIERIISIGYIERNKKTLQLTVLPVGSQMVAELDKKFTFMEYSYTAELEGAFDLIANRKAEYLAVVHGAWEKLQTELTEFKGEMGAANQADEIKPIAQSRKEPVKRDCSPGDKCPSCEGGKLTVKKLNNGANAGRSFIGCTRFPSCRFFNWMH